jgi:hypothetical protein
MISRPNSDDLGSLQLMADRRRDADERRVLLHLIELRQPWWKRWLR